MSKLTWSLRWPAALVGATAIVLAGVGATALAGHLSGDVRSYTGCVALNGGTLSLLNEGDQPLKKCSNTQQEVHLSGGDITELEAGPGLKGGGDNGKVTLEVDADHPAGVEVWHAYRAVANVPANTDTTVVGLDLPAGTYSVNVTGYAVENQNMLSDALIITCRLGDTAETSVRVLAAGNPHVPFALHEIRSLAADGSATLVCHSFVTPNNQVKQVHITATKVSALHEQ